MSRKIGPEFRGIGCTQGQVLEREIPDDDPSRTNHERWVGSQRSVFEVGRHEFPFMTRVGHLFHFRSHRGTGPTGEQGAGSRELSMGEATRHNRNA